MISSEVAGFLEQGLSIHVASRDADLVPVGARALALRVGEDGRRLTVYLTQAAADRLRPALDASRQAAVNVGRPADDRACQVKGVVDAVRPTLPDEAAPVARQWEGFLGQLETVGISRAVVAAWPTQPVVAVELHVTAVFEQTPGPLAGLPMPDAVPESGA